MTSTAEDRPTGAHRAAILMVLLGEEAATSLYRVLPEKTVQMITAELSTLSNVSPESAEQVLEEYIQLSKAQDYIGGEATNMPSGCW